MKRPFTAIAIITFESYNLDAQIPSSWIDSSTLNLTSTVPLPPRAPQTVPLYIQR